jgi:hypothetical protein
MRPNKENKMKKVLRMFMKIALGLFVLVLFVYIVSHVGVFLKQKKVERYIQKERQLLTIRDSLYRLCEIARARENIRRGNIIVDFHREPYLEDIVIKDYGLYADYTSVYEKRIMDSVLFLRYGNDFYDKIHRKSDSLYKKRPYDFIDLDGYNVAAYNEPEYNCGGVDGYHKLIEDRLFSLKLLPLQQDACFSDDLIIDAVITKKGKLTKARVLKKLNPQIDSVVISLLQSLPCDWTPAKNDENVTLNFRRRFYFFLSKKNLANRINGDAKF